MTAVFLKTAGMSLAASLMIVAVVAVRFIFRKGPKWIICVLWAMVAIKLVCPLQLRLPICTPCSKLYDMVYSQEIVLLQPDPVVSPHGSGTGAPQSNSIDGYSLNESVLPDGSVFAFSAIWCFGASAMLICAAAKYLKLREKVSGLKPTESNIYICDGFDTSFILGIVHPKIVVPSGADGKYLLFSLKHERAHLKRGDHLWKLIAYIVLAIHWFNPLVWAAFALFSRDIEYACDERVIEEMDRKEVADYSQVLLDHSGEKQAAQTVAFEDTAVRSRVKRALEYHRPRAVVVAVLLAVCLIVGVCFMTVPALAKDGEPAAEAKEWVWPCDSLRVTFPFGQFVRPIYNTYGFSDHICIGAKTGENIYAAYSGRVEFAGFDDAYGNCIIIKHDADAKNKGIIQTAYKCLSTISVKEGETVYAGQIIGTVGATGSKATGPHLNFCVLKDSKAVDPLDYYEDYDPFTWGVDQTEE